MRFKILWLALAGLTLAVLSAGAAMADDGADSSSSQFKNAKIINTVVPPRRATYPTGPRTRGRTIPSQPVFANQNAISNQAAPAENAPPMASAPESPSTLPMQRGRRVPPVAGVKAPAIASAPAAVIPHPAVVNAPAAAKPSAAVAACPVPGMANTSAGLDNTASPEYAPILEVSVKDNLATVRIENTPMQNALHALAKEGGFNVMVYGSSPDNNVSTEFRDMDLERAAIRIMSLAGMKNYFFHYDDKGALTLLETFAPSGGVKMQPNTPVRRPVATRVVRPQVPAERPEAHQGEAAYLGGARILRSV